MGTTYYIIDEVEGNTDFRDNILTVVSEGVLIIYGNGADLGDFKQYAESLKKESLAKFASNNIVIESIQDKNTFFSYLENFTAFKIKELHVFSHAAGGGLYIGYHNEESDESRNRAFRGVSGRHITYEEVIRAEIGAVFTDDFLRPDIVSIKTRCRSIFSKNAFIKFWGCNSGVDRWVYSDDPGQYYWQALNTKNTPKPSVAQAAANYFNVNTYGATSGSHVEYKIGSNWQKLEKQPVRINGIRLHPDRGVYNLYTPK